MWRLAAAERQNALEAVRALKRMASREQVLVDVARWLEGYAEIEGLLNDRVEYRFERLARELARMAAGPDRARRALASDASIRDICGLLEERGGVKVSALRLASDAFFGLSVAKDDGVRRSS